MTEETIQIWKHEDDDNDTEDDEEIDVAQVLYDTLESTTLSLIVLLDKVIKKSLNPSTLLQNPESFSAYFLKLWFNLRAYHTILVTHLNQSEADRIKLITIAHQTLYAYKSFFSISSTTDPEDLEKFKFTICEKIKEVSEALQTSVLSLQKEELSSLKDISSNIHKFLTFSEAIFGNPTVKKELEPDPTAYAQLLGVMDDFHLQLIPQKSGETTPPRLENK